jgi:hypothetical protein
MNEGAKYVSLRSADVVAIALSIVGGGREISSLVKDAVEVAQDDLGLS